MHILWYLRLVLAPFFKKYYNIELEGNFPSPPFLLIANHTHTFDPFFISTYLKNPISWVVAKGNFNRPVIGSIFKSMKFIPKQKGMPDVSTIRGILKNLKEGNIVGIFLEGSVTWDGSFQEIPKGTDKLLDMVKVPIVAVKIKGGYLTNPRWANYGRRGKIILEVKEFNNSTALDFINHNEWNWQEKEKIKFKGRNKASGVERILWFCLNCKSFRTVQSNGDQAVCSKCGGKYEIDEYGFLNGKRIDNVLKEQILILNNNFHNIKSIPKAKIIVRDKSTTKLKLVKKGDLFISEKGIYIDDFILEFKKIKGVTTFLKRFTEFIYNLDNVIRIKTENDSLLLFFLLRRYLHVYSNS